MGQRIRQLRKQRGLTLEAVASQVGVTAQALSQWENDVTKGIKPENFLRFCDFFDVDPFYVAFGVARREFRRPGASQRKTG